MLGIRELVSVSVTNIEELLEVIQESIGQLWVEMLSPLRLIELDDADLFPCLFVASITAKRIKNVRHGCDPAKDMDVLTGEVWPGEDTPEWRGYAKPVPWQGGV